MKPSAVFALAAGLAAASPLQARQDTSDRSLLQAANSALQQADTRPVAFKKPFLQPKRWKCGNSFVSSMYGGVGHSEACQGTTMYCHYGLYPEFGESFGNEEECLKSREDPSKKTFKGKGEITYDCGYWSYDPRQNTEDCAGTIEYCRRELFKLFGESYDSEEECLRARDPTPLTPTPVSPKPAPEPAAEPASSANAAAEGDRWVWSV